MAEQAVVTEQVKEESNLPEAVVTESSEYQMDLDPFKVKINILPNAEKKHEVIHKCRKPNFVEEEARERMMPLIISDAGKIDGADASSMSLDDEPANVRMYDKIAISVTGYALERGQKPTDEEIPVDRVIAVNGEEKKVLDLIPPSHKSAVINGLYPATYEVDFGEDEFYFALGGGREWKIRQEIGGRFKREDGTLSPPDYTLYYIFREPTQEERKKFRSQAINAVTLKTTSGNKDRRSTNLRVVVELFDSLIQVVDGGTVEGGNIDTRNKKHLEKIPAPFKKGALIRLMNFLEADLSD